jgi:hypothetical protein
MKSNVITKFGEHELASATRTRWLAKSRYAIRHDASAPGQKALHRVPHKQPVLTGIVRWVDGGTVAATTFLMVFLARSHLSHEQAATLAAADLVAVLTFFLISHIRDHQFSNNPG